MNRYFRSCILCSSRWYGNELFCWPCWKDFLAGSAHSYGLNDNHRLPGQHFYLWLWSAQSEILPRLILALKAQNQERFQRKLLEQLFLRTPDISWVADQIVYVTRKGAKDYDHTSVLAESMGSIMGRPVMPLYLKEELPDYKSKSRQERFLLRKVVCPEVAIAKGAQILFVDDVYTSGATAHAAWKALGEPENFNAFTLAFKRYEDRKER